MRNALEALTAADHYITQLIPHLHEVSYLFREGDRVRGREELSNALAGIGFLADLLAAVGRATGVDLPPSGDHELGRVALALNELKVAEQDTDLAVLVAVLEEDLIPSILRLAPAFPVLEARVAASVQ